MDLNQDIGALARELFTKKSASRSSSGVGDLKMHRIAPALAFLIPTLGAMSVPLYQYASNVGLTGDYQSNVGLLDWKLSEIDSLSAALQEQILRVNTAGGLFEEQREIEQFFSFIADEVVSHRLTTQSFSQSLVMASNTEEDEQQFYVVNPGAELDLSGDYSSVMAFLTAIRDLDKEIVVSSLTLGHSEAQQNNPDAVQSSELGLSLSLQVFRLVSAPQ